MLKRVMGYGLLGATAYATQDAINDAIIYSKCKAMVMERAQNHERFTSALGANYFGEFEFGPWYDSSVSLSHGGMVAAVTLPCRGPQQGSDITVKVIRKGGFRWPLLYNILGGDWEPIIMDAKIGMGAGGNLSSMSLLEQRVPELDGSGRGEAAVAEAAAHPHISKAQQPPKK